MEDVKTDVQSETVETEPTGQEPQPAEQTAEVPEVKVDRTVPYTRFSDVNKKYKEAQRKLAEVEGKSQLGKYDPTDLEGIMSHPFVQDLLIKSAKQELTDYARTTLEQYPNLNPSVKKAILANVRGFVKENTNDVESAKLDLQDYIESILEEEPDTQTPTPKTFQVASTNQSKVDVDATRPAEIEAILNKPLTEWSKEETATVEKYAKENPKK